MKPGVARYSFSRGYNALVSPDEVELPLLLVVRGNVHAAVVQSDRTKTRAKHFAHGWKICVVSCVSPVLERPTIQNVLEPESKRVKFGLLTDSHTNPKYHSAAVG